LWNNFQALEFHAMSTPIPIEAGLRVLLVDDHDDLLLMMGMMLKRKRGFAVETASSGHQAIAMASQFCPHLVISDITMPGMNGFQMMNELKAKDLAPFKSIALSGHDLPHEDRKDSGYDIHLTKPVDFDELFSIIEHLIEAKMRDG